MGSFIDITGQRFGRLAVVSRAKNQGTHTVWLCRCDCGRETTVIGENLKRGYTVSCGCYRKEYEQHPTHIRPIHGHASGGAPTPTYVSYRAMVARVTDNDHRSWEKYGGRGIAICQRWLIGDGALTGFQCFLADVGERPSGTSLDRINGDGNYEPGNCRWADAHTQARNRASTKLTAADVVRIRSALLEGETPSGLAKAYGLNAQYVRQIGNGQRRSHG